MYRNNKNLKIKIPSDVDSELDPKFVNTGGILISTKKPEVLLDTKSASPYFLLESEGTPINCKKTLEEITKICRTLGFHKYERNSSEQNKLSTLRTQDSSINSLTEINIKKLR